MTIHLSSLVVHHTRSDIEEHDLAAHSKEGLSGARSSLLRLVPELMRICDKGSQLSNVEFDSYDALTAGCIQPGVNLKSTG